MDRNSFGRKKNGKKDKKAQNIFALITNNRQDRSWRGMRELYHFNSNVELAEYSLPIVSDEKEVEEEKLQPGVVNVDGVHVKMGTKANKLDPLDHHYQSQDSRREILEEAEEDMEDMNEERYYEEEEVEDKSLDSDELEEMLNAKDEKADNDLAMAKNSMFVEKGTLLYRQRAEIKTGEQAISFFAKHGNNTPIKIFNCNRSKVPPGVFRPYDLEVVLDEKYLNEEYFTISNRGVVHVFKKNTTQMNDETMVPTEFLFASDWMHEATLFNVLSSMKFFKNYLNGKIFNSWKANVRHKRFIRTRQKISQKLKFMRPAFQNCFLEVNSTLYEMQKVKCFKELKPTKTYKLEEDFIPDQKKGREDAKNHYENKINDITNRLIELTNEVAESKNIRDEEDFENTGIGQKVKHKAMTVQKKEEQTKRDVLKIAKRNIADLGTFIRLIDYMVVETQVKINQEGADMVYAEMSMSDRKAGINSDINYDAEGGMSFNPPEGEFIQHFDKMLDEMVNAVNDISRITNNHHFTQYIQGIVSESGANFKDIVKDSENYILIKNKITQKFIDDFAQLKKDSARFEECRVINDFFEEFDFIEFKKANHDLTTIQKKLEQLKDWDFSIASVIKAQIIKGVIYGNGKTLRDKLSKLVRDNLQNIRGYLENLTLEKQQDILNRLNKINKSMKANMSTLTEYVDYVENLNN
jgi:dynein heavy chain, axonemal